MGPPPDPPQASLDSCFYVHALDYHWHAVDRQPFRAAADGRTTFFYDGACSVCVREMAHWRRLLETSDDARLALHDISAGDLGRLGDDFGVGVDEAMKRAHVIDSDGTLRTGIAAFVAAWAHLPRWKYLAMLLQLPMATSVAELLYCAWASARPMIKASAPEAARASPGASCRYVPGQKGQAGRGCE